MKISVFFLLFSIAGNVQATETWLRISRVRSLAFNVNDISELVETTRSGFGDFHRLLDEKYDPHNDIRFPDGTSPVETVRGVRRILNGMCRKFVALSYAYFARHMIEYFALAERHLSDHPYDETDVTARNDARHEIGLRDDHSFCAITAVYDGGIEVNDLLYGVFFSLTVGRERLKGFLRPHMIEILGLYREIYENHVREQRRAHSHLLPSAATDDLLPSTFKGTLPEIKTKITDFSDRFCSRWRPFVGDYLLSDDEDDDEAKGDFGRNAFVCHVFENELCEIHHSGVDYHCDNILESLDYGYEKYKEKVTKINDKSEKKKCFFTMKDCIFKKAMNSLQKRKTPPIKQESIVTAMSLSDLRENVNKYFDEYINAVNYYNIASTIMLFVSIKEGRKIMKGIRHVVTRSCTDNADKLSVDEILGLRLTLSAFKTILDDLVFYMLDTRRINVGDNKHKKTFDRQVTSLTGLLDIRDKRTDDGMSIRKMCNGVPDLLDEGNYKAHLSDDAYHTIRFHEYYLSSPILNIKQLYLFYVYDFL